MQTYRRTIGIYAAVTAILITIMSSGSSAGSSPVASYSFDKPPIGKPWQDGSLQGAWRSVYNGYGTNIIVAEGGSKMLSQSPLRSTSPRETHASLVTTQRQFGDIDLRVRTKTVRHLRTSSPNTWEVSWVLWNYTDDLHFYYLILKPNGWELGKEDPAYPGAQRFLATGSSPKFPIGNWYNVRIQQVGDTISAWADGVKLVTFRDTERPYRKGSVGLYNEDAEVRFDDVEIHEPS